MSNHHGTTTPNLNAINNDSLSDDRLTVTAQQIVDRVHNTDIDKLNESNARVTLIEPTLSALGWDVLNINSVTREYLVHDGTFLDYALLIDGSPVLFCEAKPPRKRLDDPKWVSQTINYGNSQGVPWCVLTDGLTWRVFKSNADGPMERKLAFEVRISELLDKDAHVRERAHFLFSHLTPEMVSDGELSRLGTKVFVDGRVRESLIALLAEPHPGLVKLIRTGMGTDTDIRPADIRGALSRILPSALVVLNESDLVQTTFLTHTSHQNDAKKGGTPSAVTVPSPPDESVKEGNAVPLRKPKTRILLEDVVKSGVIPTPADLTPTWLQYSHLRATLLPDGAILFQGNRYSTPSSAGRAVLGGEGPNGWTFWATMNGTITRTLDEYRKEYVKRTNAG